MNEYLDLGLISSFVPAASSFAGDIDFIFDFITLIVGFWFIITMATLFYFILRFRRRVGVNAKYITGGKAFGKGVDPLSTLCSDYLRRVFDRLCYRGLGPHQADSTTE